MRYTSYKEIEKLSRICFGTMRFADQAGDYSDRSKRGERAMRLALDRGINFIHSSFQYDTRWLADRVLKDHPMRNDLVHMIKVVVPDLGDERRFSAAKFRGQVEDALRELHTDHIAFVQFLFKDTTYKADEEAFLPLLPELLPAAREVFGKLRDEGKVSYLGGQGNTLNLHKAMLEQGDFDFAVHGFNALDLRMAEYYPKLRELGLDLFPIQPFAAGVLTTSLSDRDSLPSDHRLRQPHFDRFFERLDRLREEFGDELGKDVTGFGLRFPFSLPNVPAIITGMSNEQQLEEALEAVDGPIPSYEAAERALRAIGT